MLCSLIATPSLIHSPARSTAAALASIPDPSRQLGHSFAKRSQEADGKAWICFWMLINVKSPISNISTSHSTSPCLYASRGCCSVWVWPVSSGQAFTPLCLWFQVSYNRFVTFTWWFRPVDAVSLVREPENGQSTVIRYLLNLQRHMAAHILTYVLRRLRKECQHPSVADDFLIEWMSSQLSIDRIT